MKSYWSREQPNVYCSRYTGVRRTYNEVASAMYCVGRGWVVEHQAVERTPERLHRHSASVPTECSAVRVDEYLSYVGWVPCHLGGGAPYIIPGDATHCTYWTYNGVVLMQRYADLGRVYQRLLLV